VATLRQPFWGCGDSRSYMRGVDLRLVLFFNCSGRSSIGTFAPCLYSILSRDCPFWLLLCLLQPVTLLFQVILQHQSNKDLPSMAQMVSKTSNYLRLLTVLAISVGWNTYEQLSQPCVQYGTSSGSLTLESCSTTSVTYPTSRTWSNAVILSGLTPATTYYYKIVSTNSSVEHFFSPRISGDTTPFTLSAVIDLGVYGADGYTISMDATKRDTIPTVQPALNHTTIGRLATNINNYELVVHPGDFGLSPLPTTIPKS
jgi:hypothetical protein